MTEPGSTPPEQTVHPLVWCVQTRQLISWMNRHGIPDLNSALRRLTDQTRGSASGSVQETFIDLLNR